jgi:glucose/arabinose dehydrogenase
VLIDAVPTSVVAGPDGAYYVGELTGAPFFTGAANIYRVIPGEAPITNPEVYLTGFRMIIDIAFDAAGNLYVLQFGGAIPGVLKRVELNGCITAPDFCPRTDVVSGLTRPTSLTIDPDGALYVTNNGTSPTAGEVIRIEP